LQRRGTESNHEREKRENSGAAGKKEIGLGFDGTDAEVVLSRERKLGGPLDPEPGDDHAARTWFIQG
jgi:hypothetical protein